MSDSDDTDVLLLIPPNFFLVHTSSSCDDSDSEGLTSFESTVIAGAGRCLMAHESTPNSTASQQYQREMNTINNQLNAFENNYRSETLSDDLTFSLRTNSAAKHRLNFGEPPMISPLKLTGVSTSATTTPSRHVNFQPPESSKSSATITTLNTNRNTGVFLSEIDHFLSGEQSNVASKKITPNNSIIDVHNFSSLSNLSRPCRDMHALTRQTIDKHNRMMVNEQQKIGNNEDIQTRSEPCPQQQVPRPCMGGVEPLMSLSEIWEGNKQHNETLSLQEERLRRLHCEKSIQVLQARLLEYQQKITVALTVDKAKDDAVRKLNDNNLRLTAAINQAEVDISDLRSKLDRFQCMENDFRQSLDLTNKLREENDMLTKKCESLTQSSNEIREIHKNQIKDLEIRLSNSEEAERILREDIRKLKNSLEKEKSQNSSCKTELHEVKKQVETLLEQKSHLLEKCRDERTKTERADKEKSNLKQAINVHEAKEKNLLRDMETLKISLKSYYQTQVENVVKHKLDEFQKQLDASEQEMKEAAKQRERKIAERALQQMERMNEKSEQEVMLLNEKHNEEIMLYRIQMVNASKIIEDLKNKLSAYQSKRADIAERLHSVMETQWQKALEIIGSPMDGSGNNRSKFFSTKINHDQFDGTTLKKRDDSCVTPTSCRNAQESENNERPTMAYVDKMNEYVEMLLKKSPRDLDKLEEYLEMAKCKGMKSSEVDNQTNLNSKPPWR